MNVRKIELIAYFSNTKSESLRNATTANISADYCPTGLVSLVHIRELNYNAPIN